MTIDEFKAALTRLEWKQIDFCRKAGVSATTVSRWTTEESPIPRWVAQYLGVVEDVKALYDKYGRKPPKPGPGEPDGESDE